MKYIIEWDIGNGPEFEEIETVDMYEADSIAHQRHIDAALAFATYDVHVWTEELLEECGLTEAHPEPEQFTFGDDDEEL